MGPTFYERVFEGKPVSKLMMMMKFIRPVLNLKGLSLYYIIHFGFRSLLYRDLLAAC